MKKIIDFSKIHSMRMKMLAYFLLVAVIPTYVSALFIIDVSGAALEKETAQRMQSIASLKISQMLSIMRSHKDDITAFANGEREFTAAVRSIIIDGHAEKRSFLYQRLNSFLFNHSNFSDVFFMDPQTGTIVVSTDSSQEKKIKNSDSFFREGRFGPFAKYINHDSESNKSSTFISAPVRDKETGELLAVVAGRVELYEIDRILADRSGLGKTGRTYATNIVNEFVSDSDNLNQNNLRVQNIQDSQFGATIYMRSGREVIGYYSYISELGMVFMVEQDVEEVFLSQKKMEMRLYLLLFFTIVVASGAGYFAAGKLADPIEKLTSEARKLSAGIFQARADAGGKDEIGILGKTFNEMVEKLEHFYDELQRKVQEKTKALAEEVNNAKRFQEAVESSEESISITSADEKIMYVNRAFETLTGYAQKEVLGKNLHLLLRSSENQEDAYDTMRKTVALGKSFVFNDIVLKNKKGGWYHAEMALYPVKEKGGVVFYVQIQRDITQRIEIDRVKNEFISIASHQLRTPLTAMKWFSEILQGGEVGKLTKKQRSVVRDISLSSDRMIELVNALLTISRLEAGHIAVSHKSIHIENLVDGLLKDLSAIIQKKHLRVVKKVSHLPVAHTDPDLLREIYANLIGNAVKYTPRNGFIEISVVVKSGKIVSHVKDAGYGISQQEQKRIFEKFFRAENVVLEEPNGNGLGLYLTKAFVELLGGKIWFLSRLHKGSTFSFSIPLNKKIDSSAAVAYNKDV